MASNSDLKLQLVIEAINRSESAFAKVKKDLVELEAESTAATSAGARGFSSMGPSVALFRDHVAAAKAELPGLEAKVASLKSSLNIMGTSGAAAGASLEEAGKKGAAGMDKIHDHAQGAHSMLGQMVQMAIIMGTLLFAKKIAEAGIDYNKALETSKLGIAAIMTSMGVITDQQGKVLQGQEKWNVAQQLSVEAQRELERIAMTTPATYQEVVQAYQGLLAPALAAKMTFAETLELTGLLTNSVKAMGLPAQQIVQEGRDLVAGTIDQNSQLARSLQITNEDVKKWREKGTVFTEIKSRLDGFIFASKEFENTWEGAWSNFKDIAQHALGDGSKPIFNYLKQEITKITRDMVDITKDADGKIIDIQVKPEVVARIRELAEDLKKLVQLLELAVKWGAKFADPAMFIAIAVGVGKITTAVKELGIAANAGGLAKLISSLPTLALVAGLWGGKKYGDYKTSSEEAAEARRLAQTGTDHESARLRASGVQPMQHLEDFGPGQMDEVKKRLPTADLHQIATMLRRGIISTYHDTTPWQGMPQNVIAVKIDDSRAKQFLEGGNKSPFDIKGPNNKTPAEIKKEREEFIAAMEDSYAESAGKFKVLEAKEAEAIKSGLKEKELSWQQGLITEGEYLQARADLEEKALNERLQSIASQQSKLTEKYKEEAAQITDDPKEASEKHKAYVTAWYALEVDFEKTLGDKKRRGFEEDLKQAAARKNLATAQREGALKLLQEQLSGEKQLTQLLLDREKITPLQAEQRNIANDQSGLEADYWNTFAKKKVGGLTADQIAELNAQLTVLEERMKNLAQATPDRLYKAGTQTVALDAKREEARISHELADLEDKEKLREVGKLEALRQRKELLDDLLNSQLDVQDALDPGDTTAWNSQQAAIDGTRQKILELTLSMRDLSDEMAGGLLEGLKQYVDENGGIFKHMVDLSKSTASAMQQGFSDFFFDAMQGKMKNFKDYFNAFLSSIERALANVMSQQIVLGALSGMGVTMQAQGGAWEGGVQRFAQGGVVLQPTLFRTASGMGEMGEAGPEAIMPLTRTASGALGVRALGGGAGNIQFSQQISIDSRGNASSQGTMDSSQASQLGNGLQAIVTQYLIQQQRPGGLLYRG